MNQNVDFKPLDEAGVSQLVKQLYSLKHFGKSLQNIKNVTAKAHQATYRERPHRVPRNQNTVKRLLPNTWSSIFKRWCEQGSVMAAERRLRQNKRCTWIGVDTEKWGILFLNPKDFPQNYIKINQRLGSSSKFELRSRSLLYEPWSRPGLLSEEHGKGGVMSELIYLSPKDHYCPSLLGDESVSGCVCLP